MPRSTVLALLMGSDLHQLLREQKLFNPGQPSFDPAQAAADGVVLLRHLRMGGGSVIVAESAWVDAVVHAH